jgi:hypothetical protein
MDYQIAITISVLDIEMAQRVNMLPKKMEE